MFKVSGKLEIVYQYFVVNNFYMFVSEYLFLVLLRCCVVLNCWFGCELKMIGFFL